jgi:hypothetical protein
VLLVDRYELGARATSACAAPTPWLLALGLGDAIRQQIPHMRCMTPHGSVRYRLPWSRSAFDYRHLCHLLYGQSGSRFETATVKGRPPVDETLPGERISVVTDRGLLKAPLVVDVLGWRRVLGRSGYQPPAAPLSRGLEVHPDHCFPLSGEGIRAAFYFGIACGRELTAVLEQRRSRAAALERYGSFSAGHGRAFAIAGALQRTIRALPPRLLTAGLRLLARQWLIDRCFGWYLDQTPPPFALREAR